jgi:gamma-glutamylcyclotransferase (GGCT)/AIG2-like uncharacterized protein YtfP
MSIEGSGYYAFYGTLRQRMENHGSFAKTLNYLDTVTLHGYRMYSLVEYPYVIYTGDDHDLIVAELFKVTALKTEEMIFEMEVDAGYILSSVIIDGNKFGLYIFQENDPTHAPVPDGDWVRHATGGSF